MSILDDMRALATVLTEDERITRPVTCDPRNIVPPCVLIDPPKLDNSDRSLCGSRVNQFRVHVIGLPGAEAELSALAELLDQVLEVLDDAGPGWISADLEAFYPFGVGAAVPSLAYVITTEEYSS